MAPRVQSLISATQGVVSSSYQPLAPFLYPFLSHQRYSSILSSLSDVPSSYNKKIRRGRGPASGKGKTSGRGHKGQGQHGKVPYKFNGGQTPDEVVAGSRGWDNVFAKDMAVINLNRIQMWIDKGRIDPSKPITVKELKGSKCIGAVKDGVKLLARGSEELRSKINIVVSRASEQAIEAIEKAGGNVVTRFYSPFALKKILAGQMDPLHSLQSRLHLESDVSGEPLFARHENEAHVYRLPDPASRKDIEYYRDPAKRGYLAYNTAAGANPSLFFKTPGPYRRSTRLRGDNSKQSEELTLQDAESVGKVDTPGALQEGKIVANLQRAAKSEEKMW